VAAFVAQVPLRWIDQDVYGHVNHARAVTLLEEARVAMVFDAAADAGVTTFAAGLLVVGLHVDYRRQIAYRGSSPGAGTVRVAMDVDELRAASFRIRYALHDGPGADAPVAVHAWTRMATYDLAAGHPRRLTPDERALLGRWGDDRSGRLAPDRA
jgi:acyl-CoA thioester hydrolase